MIGSWHQHHALQNDGFEIESVYSGQHLHNPTPVFSYQYLQTSGEQIDKLQQQVLSLEMQLEEESKIL